MSAADPSFVDVRTHGNIGDLASDGLTLHDGKLYACYAPEKPDVTKTISKFESDLENAIKKRGGQFTEFVFVHNDARGIHPELSKTLSSAASKHPDIKFSTLGMRHIRDMLGPLDRNQVEQLLGVPLPVQHEISFGLSEMEELLKYLAKQRIPSDPAMGLEQVSARKLDHNEFSPDTQSELREGMKYSSIIDSYYQDRIDVTERDEVAARFQAEYASAAEELDDPEDIMLRLRIFLSGTKVTRADDYRAQTAILAYFFQTCDIFEDAPDDQPATPTRVNT